MKEDEVRYIKKEQPLVTEVLKIVGRGESITPTSPFFLAYLFARQRGFVQRAGDDGKAIVVSNRGKEFLEHHNKLVIPEAIKIKINTVLDS